jgi:hypothetical protein
MKKFPLVASLAVVLSSLAPLSTRAELKEPIKTGLQMAVGQATYGAAEMDLCGVSSARTKQLILGLARKCHASFGDMVALRLSYDKQYLQNRVEIKRRGSYCWAPKAQMQSDYENSLKDQQALFTNMPC